MRGRSAFVFRCVVSCLLVVAVYVAGGVDWVACAQLPDLNGGSDLAASGKDTAEWLKSKDGKEKNKYRVDPGGGGGSVSGNEAVRKNMQKLFEKIYVKPGPDNTEIDKWFSPHLRDILVKGQTRSNEVTGPEGRARAGSPYVGPFCYGACPGCLWPNPSHQTPLCCGVSTARYAGLTQDTNFKACCVRAAEQFMTMEEIACLHPTGDGWAGLFEYYYPATAIGWEAQRATTMIASNQDVSRCLARSDRMMERAQWVKDAIKRNLQTVGGSANESNLNAIGEVIKSVRPEDKKLRFTDSLQGGGLTMRVNFAHMDPAERRLIARQFCMHPDQFMKLMDPNTAFGQGDPTQKGGGSTLAALYQIPMWANYCPNAVKLMTDASQTNMVMNLDGTPTQFFLGMTQFNADPLYCQKMNAFRNPKGAEFLLEGVLKKKGASMMPEQMTGYTCRTGNPKEGGFQTRMVPVELHSTAKIDPRTLDHAIPFMIAGGYYLGEMYDGVRSFYKRFEPIAYSQRFGLFKGEPFTGGGVNELGQNCRSVSGEDYQGDNKPDQLYLSNVNHSPFSQEVIQEFNQYDREWADDKMKFHNRNKDESVLNYGAAFRIFATCPKGYVRWRGPHSEKFAGACGEEHFGGRFP